MIGRRAERAREVAELEALRPYLELAREIREDVARAADGPVGVEDLAATIGRIPERERDGVVRAIFDRLTPTEQWAVVERAFGDEEIRRYLDDRRADRLAAAARANHYGEIARAARAAHAFDPAVVPVGERLTLGLFPEAGVRAVVTRGRRSAGCARRIVLLASGDGRFRVLDDVFDPDGSYFVTGEYDRETWRTAERLTGHATVRVGSMVAGRDGAGFEPVIYPGGRLDVETVDGVVQGKLHVGFVVLGDKDVFNDE
jgi:hypothetical protein